MKTYGKTVQRKILVMTIVSLLVMQCALGSCANPMRETNAPGSSMPEQGEDPIDSGKSPVRITLLMAESDFPEWPTATTPNFKDIQKIALEQFNIDYRLETYLSSEGESLVSTRMAAGVKMPDVVDFAFNREKLISLYDNGLILRLNELIQEYCPNYQALLDIRPYLQVAHGNSEGDILRMPANYEETPQHCVQVLHIRNDWLTQIGKTYEDVRTPDDLYVALKEFQDNDVNRNGRKDEVLATSGLYGTFQLMRVLGTAFGSPNTSQSLYAWYFDGNGQVYNCNVTDQTKEMVIYINKLYNEGLISAGFVSQDNSYNQMLVNNQIAVLSGSWWDSVVLSQLVRNRGWEGVEYVPLGRPITKNDEPIHYYQNLIGYGGYMLTKDCADPAAVMRFYNWGYSKEGSVKNYYGVDNIDVGSEFYTKSIPLPGLMLPDDQMDGTDYYREQLGYEPMLVYKMGWNQNYSPKLFLGNSDMVVQEFFVSFTPEKSGLSAEIDFNKNGLSDVVNYGIPSCDFASPTLEESNVWNEFSDLWLYMDTTIIQFITGQLPMSEWDSYVSQCESMGLINATSIRQAQYDRCMEIMAK